MRTAESETVSTQVNGVTVEKRFEPDDFPVPAIAFTIRSERDDPITLRMVDILPEEVDPAHIGFHPDHGGEHWSVENDTVVFKRPLDPHEEYVTVYGLRHIYVDTASRFLVEPDIEVLDPATDILGEDSSQHVRDIIAGDTENVRGLNKEEETAAAGPAIESVATALADEIETGDVDDETLSVLREHLGVTTTTTQKSKSKGDSSMDARIRRLQADVGDLRAYTDAIEGFLDENGEAQQILSQYREELENLQPRISDLEDQTDETDTELTSAVSDLSSDIDALSSNIESDIDALSSSLESLDSDVSDLQSRVRRMKGAMATEDDVEELRADLDDLADFRKRMQTVFAGSMDANQ